MAEQEKSIGALWAKKSTKGADYFSGTIELNGEKIQIVAFYNANKKNPKEPDYRILKSKPKEQTENNINEEDVPF